MAAAPQFKVYTGAGEYIAATKEVEDAAAIVSFRGDGTTIRSGHMLVVWTEGKEDIPAAESYDHVAETIYTRLREHRERVAAKHERRPLPMSTVLSALDR